jgi:hypothetical protein
VVRHYLPGTIAIVIGSCFLPTDTCACVLAPPSAIVFGTVSSASQSPAPIAALEITAYRPSCGDTMIDLKQVSSSVGGAYRAEIGGANPGETVCLRVWARGVFGGPADTAASVGTRVRMSTAPLRDSVRVDLQLP